MKILIAEDDFAGRKYLFKLLSQYGECDMTIDGIETVEAFVIGHDIGKPYDLVFLDIMMPKIDGLKALKAIRNFEEKRKIEESKRCKVIIISALDKSEVPYEAYGIGKEFYLEKPIEAAKLKELLKNWV